MSVTWALAMRTLRALAIMFLLPPLVLLALAHGWPGFFALNGFLVLASLMLLVVAGVAAAWTAPWPEPVRFGIGGAYLVLAIPAMPTLSLLAVCTTGDCL